MTKYIAFLKQVYFRKKFINMPELKEFFEKIGMKNVKIVFTSGNVIFDSKKDAVYLDKFISNKLKNHYMYEIDTFLKTKEEIKCIIDNNPFELKKNYYNQSFICYNNFEKILFDEFLKLELIDNEKFELNNNLLY